jgi:chromosome partitioning protein
MGMTISTTGQKGGAGKSTVAVCLAAEAIARGRSVLLVDADPQATALTWGAVAAEAGRKAPTIIAMGATMHLAGQLEQASRAYDLTIIDCPPRHGEIQRSALLVADVAVMPCGPSAADAWALSASLELIAEARVLRPALQACILITRKQGRTALGKGARAVLAESGLPVLTCELGYRIAYQEALAGGQGVTTYAPRDPAAAEIRALLDELIAMEKKNGAEKARSRSPKAARPR